MRRREFLGAVGGVAAVLGLTHIVRAQQQNPPVIGFLHSGSPSPWSSLVEAFRKGLAERELVTDRDVMIEYRWADDRFERLPSLANELVQRNVSLIFVGGGDVAALAAKAATSTIPIVFAIGADPVQQGIVTSLNRPGGNITGATFLSVEIRPKLVELIRDFFPNSRQIAVMANPQRPGFESFLGEVLAPARARGLQVHVLKAGSGVEIDAAFAELAHVKADALLVLSDPVYFNRRQQLAQLEARYRVPAFHYSRAQVEAGSLISYGADNRDSYRQAGVYAGRILKGEKPADLPVVQPTKFELVINLKTAHALGLTVPPMLLARADEVIE